MTRRVICALVLAAVLAPRALHAQAGIVKEDSAHTSGQFGFFGLAVRKDAGGTLCDTDGDFCPWQLDASGQVRVVAAQAGTWTVTGPLTDGQLRATPVPVSGTFWQSTQPISGPADTTAAGTFDSVEDTVTMVFDGRASASCGLAAGTLTGTITTEGSIDGGTTWNSITTDEITTGVRSSSFAVTNPNPVRRWSFLTPGGAYGVRIRLSAFTSGSAAAVCRASMSLNAFGLIIPINTSITGSTASLFAAQVGGTDGTNLRAFRTTTTGRIETDFFSIAGIGAQSGNGTATGALRVALPTDGTGTIGAITASVTPGTAAANLGKAEDAAHAAGDTGVAVFGVRNDPSSTQLTDTNGDHSEIAVDAYGAIYAAPTHPNRFSCFVPLTATVTTQCQAAPGAGLRAYVTSLSCSNGAATVQGVDVVFGTGTNCATGITALTHKHQMGTNQLTTSPFLVAVRYPTPLVPTAANAICTRPTAATAYGCTITGYIAP